MEAVFSLAYASIPALISYWIVAFILRKIGNEPSSKYNKNVGFFVVWIVFSSIHWFLTSIGRWNPSATVILPIVLSLIVLLILNYHEKTNPPSKFLAMILII